MTDATDLLFDQPTALSLAGLPPKMWHNLLQRDQYASAPPKKGHGRYFTTDDVVALFAFAHFRKLTASVDQAGKIASKVRRELDRCGPDLVTVWVVEGECGKAWRVMTHEPAPTEFHHAVPVHELRRQIRLIAAERGYAC